MRNITIACTTAGLVFCSGLVGAQEQSNNGYVGANYTFVTYEQDGLGDELDLGTFSGKVGARINPYVSAELRAGVGVADEKANFGGVSAKLELDYLVGGYYLFGLPNKTPIYPYIALGYTKGELTFSATGPGGSLSVSDSGHDVSYGVGANMVITDNVLLNAEYMQYIDKDDYEVSGMSIGASYLF